MTDFLLLEQLHEMIKEVPKPRLMFRKGISAGGFFRPYMSMSEYTRASIFRSLDEITPVTVRFSSMLGDQGTADTMRNIKGMDVKFSAKDGDYDMICQSLPVMFISDEAKILKLFNALSKREHFDGICNRKFWEFITDHPEAINCAIRFFSREGLSDSFVNMTWYSVNNLIWENAGKETFLIRCRWIPIMEGNACGEKPPERPDRTAAEFMAGYDPDRAGNDLKRHIIRSDFPAFELQIQMKYSAEGTVACANSDDTRRTLLWEEKDSPYLSVGIMKLTQIPENRSTKHDLISFAPGNTIDGIELYRDGFAGIMDYIYRADALERGVRI